MNVECTHAARLLRGEREKPSSDETVRALAASLSSRARAASTTPSAVERGGSEPPLMADMRASDGPTMSSMAKDAPLDSSETAVLIGWLPFVCRCMASMASDSELTAAEKVIESQTSR